MTKYYYTTEKDRSLIVRSFNNIAYLIFGKNNQKGLNAYRKFFEEKVKRVSIYPQGTITKKINHSTPGICRMDTEEEKLIIEMLGYSGSTMTRESQEFIKHEGTHELCHSFVDLLPTIFSNYPKGIIKNGIKCENCMGMIKETDPLTGDLVGQHYYGKMFNETMMDIISSIGINAFDTSNSRKTADDILRTDHTKWGNATTAYSMFTSITRLAIAAFSNNGFANYEKVINQGMGIFDIKTKMKNQEFFQANDFLYGIVYDPLHIEQEFDRFMGEGYYRDFCEYLDRLFVKSLSTKKISSEEVKKIMNVLPDFLNKKIAYYLKNGITDQKSANKVISNFNRIWNSMQVEYASYFSKEDINEIQKRAKLEY